MVTSQILERCCQQIIPFSPVLPVEFTICVAKNILVFMVVFYNFSVQSLKVARFPFEKHMCCLNYLRSRFLPILTNFLFAAHASLFPVAEATYFRVLEKTCSPLFHGHKIWITWAEIEWPGHTLLDHAVVDQSCHFSESPNATVFSLWLVTSDPQISEH